VQNYVIEQKTLPVHRVLAARGTASDFRHVAQPMRQLFALLETEMRARDLRSAQPCVVIWHGDYRSEVPFTLEVAMGFEGHFAANSSIEVNLTQLPSLEVVSTVHYGSFEQFAEAYSALKDCMEREGFEVSGEVREVYIHVDQDEAKHVSELQIPIRKL
jgi:effector-binding domain-containing protein